MDKAILTATIAASVSIISMIWTYFTSRKNNREIELLKSKLQEEKSEKDARREYLYEAKKRLYEEYEPLYFQLTELSENAYHRIMSLARTAKHGNLGPNGWLETNDYYFSSTYYKLIAPLSAYKLIQDRITIVDLQVDQHIFLHYQLLKVLFLTFTDDFTFARLAPKIDYNPLLSDWKEKRQQDESRYWRQGIPYGRLENIAESLIEEDNQSIRKIISFGQLEDKLKKIENEKNNKLWVFRDIFSTFHPKNRPILWRILITQALIYRAILNLRYNRIDNIEMFIDKVTEENHKEDHKIDWRANDELEFYKNEYNDTLTIARTFLKESLRENCGIT